MDMKMGRKKQKKIGGKMGMKIIQKSLFYQKGEINLRKKNNIFMFNDVLIENLDNTLFVDPLN